jgi:hypothetical protein
MVRQAPARNPRQRSRREPLFDVHPRTGTSIEVFYADLTLETFGRCGAGWFWWSSRYGLPPVGSLLIFYLMGRYRFGSTSETTTVTASAAVNFGTSSMIAFHSGVAVIVFSASGLSNQSSVMI